MERFDIGIIGSGPGGLSAAINGKIRNKSVIVFGNPDLSMKVVKASRINNYLGFNNVTGEELKASFEEHIKAMDINIVNERINNVYAMGEYFALMVKDKIYEAKTVILATGIEYTKPFKGEEEYIGKGVGYCATCDAPLYKGKVVTIVGYNKEAEEEANYVSELASKLYYIPMYKEELNLNPSITVVRDIPLEIQGEDRVTKLIMKNNTIETDGIFLLRDSIAPGQLVPGLRIEDNHIFVDRNMNTSIPGCFAAGDCVGRPYQYIKAAGEGLIAALGAASYIDSKKRNAL